MGVGVGHCLGSASFAVASQGALGEDAWLVHRPLVRDRHLMCQDSAREWVCPTTGSEMDSTVPPYRHLFQVYFVCSFHFYYREWGTSPNAL